MGVDDLVCYEDFLAAARARLDPDAFDYFRCGALTEWTLRENEAAFARWCFHKHVMVDVSSITTSTSLLGTDVSFPVLVAPTAFHKLADPEGELATARATKAADTIMVNSTMSTVALEDVAATEVKRWFQVYILKDRSRTQRMIERAARAGFMAIVLTVDTPMIGIRYADQRNRFQLPPDMTMPTLESDMPGTDESGLRSFTEQFDQSLTWHDIEWICEVAGLPVLTKGILTGEDARRSIDAGASGVIVSNHGGRQLDGDPATLDALPEVVGAVGADATVLLDGGVRTGPDVVTAMALGADAVLVGRPVLWGLAAGGQAGVERVLDLLHTEVVDTLRQLGAPTLGDLGPELVRRVPR